MKIVTTPLNSSCQDLQKTTEIFSKAEKSQNFLCNVTDEKYESKFENLKVSQKRYVTGKFDGNFRDQQQTVHKKHLRLFKK